MTNRHEGESLDPEEREEAANEAPVSTGGTTRADWRRGPSAPPQSRSFVLGKEIQGHMSRERTGMRGSTLLERSKLATGTPARLTGGGQGGSAFDRRNGRRKGPPRDSPTWPPGRSTEEQVVRERAASRTLPEPPPPPGKERDR